MLRAIFALTILGLIGGCASKGDVDDLRADIAALSAKIEGMSTGGAKAAAPGAEDEKAASELYNAARALAGKGQNDEAKAKLEEMNKKYGATRTAQRGSRLLKELSLVGSPAQAISTSKMYQGEAPDVSSGVSMLVFWEKWCPHCRREMPEMEETFAKYKGKVSFIGLTKQSKGTSDEDVVSFIDENKLTYPIGKEDGAVSNAYAVSGIPAAAVVKDGVVVWRGHPGSLSDDMLDGFLK
jgi:thiol-disulfide isomerase/thioredoxin/outer membrane murein-binding lipoprotein Lpp